MFKKIENSWKLAKECWRILMLDKEMMIFPLMSTIVNLAVLFSAYKVLWNAGIFDHVKGDPVTTELQVIVWTVLCATLFSLYFVSSFFHSALVASALKRLKGDNPTLFDGLTLAGRRLPQIVGWAFASLLFGIVRGLIKSLFKSKSASSRVGDLLESGWNVVTVFVVPAIIAENQSIYGAFKRSGELVKKTWGEAVGLEFGFYWLATAIALPLAAMFLLGHKVSETYPLLTLSLWGTGAFLLVITSLIYSALNGIAKATIYNFANGGTLPKDFDREPLGNVIVERT